MAEGGLSWFHIGLSFLQVRRAGLVQPSLQPSLKPGTALTTFPHAPKQQLADSGRVGAWVPRPHTLQLADTVAKVTSCHHVPFAHCC